MNVLIFNTWYYPNLMGGAEHSVLLLAENLVKRNIKVAVVTVDSERFGITKENINGVTIYRLDGNKYNVRNAYFNKERTKIQKVKDKYYELFNAGIQFYIEEIINEFSPDVAHINCFSGLSYFLFKTLKKCNVSTIYTARNYFTLYPADKRKINPIWLDRLVTKVYRVCVNYYMNSINALVAPSKYTLSEIENRGLLVNCKEKCCIPNSISVNKSLTKKIIDKNLLKKENRIEFLYVGWLSEEKGIGTLLEAFEYVSNRYSNAFLKICGDGKLKEKVLMAEQNNSAIKYMGKLSPEKLYEQYISSDVLVVPSIWAEPFGRVVIEGNSFGLPVIGANSGGIVEIINTIGSGMIYDAKNVIELRNCMIKFMDREVINSYYDKILSNIELYDISHQIDAYCELYKRII